MTEQELALLEKMIDAQREMLSVLDALAETQIVIAQALLPIEIVSVGSDGPMTMQ